MANCQDLCTAAKCQELEEKIEQLELDLALLRVRFDAHLLQPIPTAHDYDEPELLVGFDITPVGNGNYIFTSTVNGESDNDLLTINPPSVLLDIFETGEDTYNFKVTVDGESDEDTLIITHPDLEIPEIEPPESNLNINGSYFDEDLTITISDGNSTDSVQINIPRNNSTTIVNNTNLENKIEDIKNVLEQCCNDINAILNLLNNVHDEVTINVSGQSYSMDCTFEEYDQQTNSPLLVPKSTTSVQTIQGNGLQGIASLISDLTGKIQEIAEKTCLNQDPAFNFTTELPFNCDPALQNQSLEDYLATNSNISWLTYLVNDLRSQGATGNNLKINNNYQIYLIYMLHLIHEQQKNLISPVCELESQDTVAVVASDRVINKVKGRQLILHFVTLDNYPKRQANSSYRPVQIPSPIPNDQLDWATHFENLRWFQGNLYAELELKDGSGNQVLPSVSGFFENQASADSYFDAVLNLTTLTEHNRKYHIHVSPTRIIPVQETRPYRAFVTFINASGQAEVEFKLSP